MDAVVRDILRIKDDGRYVFVKETRGTMRPVIPELTMQLRATVIAEEILADFKERNAQTVELNAADTIDLQDYMSGKGVDWEHLERDFPGVRTVVELSRPGCDSQDVFAIVQARFHYRDPHKAALEGRLFHVEKEPGGEWKVPRLVVWNAEKLGQ